MLLEVKGDDKRMAVFFFFSGGDGMEIGDGGVLLRDGSRAN